MFKKLPRTVHNPLFKSCRLRPLLCQEVAPGSDTPMPFAFARVACKHAPRACTLASVSCLGQIITQVSSQCNERRGPSLLPLHNICYKPCPTHLLSSIAQPLSTHAVYAPSGPCCSSVASSPSSSPTVHSTAGITCRAALTNRCLPAGTACQVSGARLARCAWAEPPPPPPPPPPRCPAAGGA